MLQTTAIAIVLGFWSILYLLDSFLKTHQRLSVPYFRILHSTGLSVCVAQLRWYTTYFNRSFIRFGSSRAQLLKTWFTLGVIFGVIAMVVSMLLLLMVIINTLMQQPVEQQVLTPVMPGVNLPMNQIVYYLLTLLVCAVFHELGHAIAAICEEVHVNGFGIFILALYPGAFVDLSTEHLQVIPPIRQLRIYCAGVWHNFVIVILAIMVLLFLPLFLLPFYYSGHAVAITDIVENSPVSGPKGLAQGDIVTGIDTCRVSSINDWVHCINLSREEDIIGFCIPLSNIDLTDMTIPAYVTITGNIECCPNTTNTHICFGYTSVTNSSLLHSCLPARSTSERQHCNVVDDCNNSKSLTACVKPSLDNSTRLLRVVLQGRQPVLFLGHPLDLFYSVSLSNYVPYWSYIPLNLPYILETFCKYLISLSGALAILNVVPCYALDGQWILSALIELTLKSVIKTHEKRTLLYTVVLSYGTLLLSANIIIALWVLFIR